MAFFQGAPYWHWSRSTNSARGSRDKDFQPGVFQARDVKGFSKILGVPERRQALATVCAARNVLLPATKRGPVVLFATALAVPQISCKVRIVGLLAFDQLLKGNAHHSPATARLFSQPTMVLSTADRDTSNSGPVLNSKRIQLQPLWRSMHDAMTPAPEYNSKKTLPSRQDFRAFQYSFRSRR